jgi:hypothetical protein
MSDQLSSQPPFVLANIAAQQYYTRIFVQPFAFESLEGKTQVLSDSLLAQFLGLVPFPNSCADARACDANGYKFLRILGVDPHMLNCNSTSFAYSNRPVTTYSGSNCRLPDVGFIQLGPHETMQTVSVLYSTIPTPIQNGCGCSAQSTPAIYSTDRIGLGTHDLPNGSRGCWKHGVDTRSEWIKVYADISHPSLGDFIQIARECAIGCATAAFITAVATNAAAAVAIAGFKVCFKACLIARVGESIANGTSISIDSQSESGDWSGH